MKEPEKKKNRLGLYVSLAVIIVGVIGTYALWPIIFPPPVLKSSVSIKAIDQENNSLVADVSVTKEGVTVSTGKTPLTLDLEYGTYTFTIIYQNLKIEKTVEVNQPTQEITVTFQIPKKVIVLVRAIDKEGNPLEAEVEITKPTGALVALMTTPSNVTLEYGTYNFTFKYKDLTLVKTVGIDQSTKEVIGQFEISPPPLVAEITADELFQKLHTYFKGKEQGKNVTELKNWLLSLENKTIRITGEIYDFDVNSKKYFTIEFRQNIDHTLYICNIGGTPEYYDQVKDLKKGDVVTIEGVVRYMDLDYHSVWMDFLKLVKKE